MIAVECADCDDYEAEVDAADLPTKCPECHGTIQRAKEPEQDDGSWKSDTA